MDIERLKDNRKYEAPGMFGDERQIALFYREQPEYRIVFWECYLMNIFCELDLTVKEFKAGEEIKVDDDLEKHIKNIMLSDNDYSEILEQGAKKIINWQN